MDTASALVNNLDDNFGAWLQTASAQPWLNTNLNKLERLQQLQQRYASIANHPFADFKLNKIVWGIGNLDSPLVFVGEGPGAQEDLLGQPFVGRAGQLLTSLIHSMGVQREQVYITNVIRCRLTGNRAPLPHESDFDCQHGLWPELAILQPKLICLLGASALQAFCGPKATLAKYRGLWLSVGFLQAMPTYHPAYLLRNPPAKKFVVQDMQLINQALVSL